MKKHLLRRILLSLTIAVLFVQCSEDDESSQSPSNEITNFSISSLNPAVSGTIDEQNGTVSLELPSGTDISALIPNITVSEKATITPASGESQDFTEPVIYTVTAENGNIAEYTVSVSVLENTEAKILSFIFKEFSTELEATVDEEEKTVTAIIPREYDIAKLSPTIVISDLASVSPSSDVEVDFTDDVIYTLVAEDGTEVKYTATISYEKRVEKSILSFEFEELSPSITGEINEEAKTILLVLPWNTSDLSAIIPTIEVSAGATVSPESGLVQNFEDNVVSYTVTAEDGSTQDYRVSVELEEAPEPIFDPLNSTTFRKGDLITITGQNFSDIQVTLSGEQMSSSPSLESQEETSFSFYVPEYASFTEGNYNLKVSVRGTNYPITELKILPPPPIINDLTISSGNGNIFITINGSNFINKQNRVFLTNSGDRTEAYIKEENSGRIIIVFPPLLPSVRYNVQVETNGAQATSTGTFQPEEYNATEPIISGVENLVVKKGEKLIIKGKNFGPPSGSVIIGFMDGWTATKTKTAPRISDSLVELVIPDDLPAKTYTIYMQKYNPDFSTVTSNYFYNIVIED